MKSDGLDLLTELGREAARAEALSEREMVLAQLTEGTLDDETRAALDQRAEQDPALALAVTRHRPLDSAARGRIADRLIAQTAAARPPAPVVPLRRRQVLAVATGALALAAGVVLWARPWPAGSGGDGGDALPAYTLGASGGDSVQRGGPAGGLGEARGGGPRRLVLGPGAPLEILARPAAAVTGPVRARLFLQQGTALQEAPLLPEVAATGAVRVRGNAAGVLGDRRGDLSLVLVIGRPTLLDGGGAEALVRRGTSTGAGWQVVSVPVVAVGDR